MVISHLMTGMILQVGCCQNPGTNTSPLKIVLGRCSPFLLGRRIFKGELLDFVDGYSFL